MTVGPKARRLVVARDESDWEQWRAENPGGEPAARVVSVAQARRMGAYDPAGWVVVVTGAPPDEWLQPILEALSAQGFKVPPAIFKGAGPYR